MIGGMLNKKWKIIFGIIVAITIGSSVFFVFRKNERVEILLDENQGKQGDLGDVVVAEGKQGDELNKMDTADTTNKTNMTDTPNTKNETSKTDKTDMTDVTNKTNIENRLVSFGFQKASGRDIDTIIIHSSYDALGDDPYSVAGLIAEYKSYGVAPHYLIDRNGKIYRLVADQNIAYHAGVSQVPDGRKNVNDFSLGIEIIEKKSDSPNGAQYSALKKLLTQLKSEYKIKYVLGHKDIAPGRKDDPWNFEESKIK